MALALVRRHPDSSDHSDARYEQALRLPVIGVESEFTVIIDGREEEPEDVWRTPSGFIEGAFLKRSTKSLQLPTGGALYFDKGVIEVVTPGIELGKQCSSRVVRNLWEQIEFVRNNLDRWERENSRAVRLRAFSAHYNVSFELPREARGRDRTIQKLVFLLIHVLPIPVILLAANKRSTGVGVRPRRNRIEVTLDFTPDAGLMAATASLIVGIVRDVMSWPSYLVSELDERSIPVIEDVEPGRHTTRKGWIVKDFHFPRSPFTTNPDDKVWRLRGGGTASLRAIAFEIASHFRDSIRAYSDPFVERLLFGVLSGEMPSLLDLPDRPKSYEDIGRAVKWGRIAPELNNYERVEQAARRNSGLDDFLREREEDRMRARIAAGEAEVVSIETRRAGDVRGGLLPPWADVADRRERDDEPAVDRRRSERRLRSAGSGPILGRSPYEEVFLRVGARKPLEIEGESWVPAAIRGWYHVVLENDEGEEQIMSIDQLVPFIERW